MTLSARWNSTRRGPRSGPTSHFPPDTSEGISAISGPRYSSSAAAPEEPSHLVDIGDAGRTHLIQLSQEIAEWAGKTADTHLSTLMGVAGMA